MSLICSFWYPYYCPWQHFSSGAHREVNRQGRNLCDASDDTRTDYFDRSPEPQDKYILSVPAWGLSIPHTPSKMSLITLDEDIFPRILSLLDVITVVRCRQV
jgi:hypothetical protein